MFKALFVLLLADLAIGQYTDSSISSTTDQNPFGILPVSIPTLLTSKVAKLIEYC